MARAKLTVCVALVAAGVLAATAFGSTSTSTISVRTTPAGKALVGPNGRTLYLLTADKGKSSTCYGQCASLWPPLIAAKPTAGAGLKVSLLGTTKRRDGKLQVTYGGHPLYFFVQDKKAGDVKGQGIVNFGGAWWVVSPAGKKIPSTIWVQTTPVGKALVGPNGRTLYLLTADKGKSSTCYGQCVSFWPPLIAAKPTAGAGLKASLLDTTKRRDGKLEVTYGGHPLYFYAPDMKAGDVNGQGIVNFGGTWWAVSPAGMKITSKP
jgi:predicted lipoprotein with Yx(FWY)xxD motif